MTDIIIDNDGSQTVVPAVQWKIDQSFGKKMDRGSLFAFQVDVEGVTLTPGETEVFLEVDGSIRFGGRLREEKDLNNGQVNLVVDPPEVYAREARPTDPDVVRESVADSTLITEVANTVPELTPGNIQTVISSSDKPAEAGTQANGPIDPGISLILSNTPQARKARKVEYVTYETSSGVFKTADLNYRFEKSGGQFPVDYTEARGSDKTGTVLSPGNQNIVGQAEVDRPQDRLFEAVRILGAAEGQHQAVYETTAASDPRFHDPISAKNYNFQNTIGFLGDHYLDEYQTSPIRVRVQVKGPDVRLGDLFSVVLPQYDLDETLRVVELTENGTSDGVITSVTLSNRLLVEESEQAKQRNNDRGFASNVQGYAQTFSENVTGAENIGPDSYTLGSTSASDLTNPVMGSVDFPPEVAEELEIELSLRGLPYQAPSSGASAAPQNTTGSQGIGPNSVVRASSLRSITFNSSGNWKDIIGFNVDENIDTWFTHANDINNNQATGVTLYSFRLYNKTQNTTYSEFLNLDVNNQANKSMTLLADLTNENVTGDDLAFQVKNEENSRDIGLQFAANQGLAHSHTVPQVAHDPSPGLVYFDGSSSLPVSGNTTTALYPEDIVVLVAPQPEPKDSPNDSVFTEVPRTDYSFEFGTDDGTGEFFTRVNLTNTLTEGYNEIRIGSKTKGRIKSSVNGEVYQRILGRR